MVRLEVQPTWAHVSPPVLIRIQNQSRTYFVDLWIPYQRYSQSQYLRVSFKEMAILCQISNLVTPVLFMATEVSAGDIRKKDKIVETEAEYFCEGEIDGADPQNVPIPLGTCLLDDGNLVEGEVSVDKALGLVNKCKWPPDSLLMYIPGMEHPLSLKEVPSIVEAVNKLSDKFVSCSIETDTVRFHFDHGKKSYLHLYVN